MSRRRATWVLLAGMTIAAACRTPLPPRVLEYQPHQASGDPLAGGRSVAVTVSPASDLVAIVATHSGGLFRTTDGGATWSHLPGFPAHRMWDASYDPADANHVIATVTIDTRVPAGSGIWRSTNGGTTWQRPARANFPDCRTPLQPAYGRGISFGPGAHVFVGTDCGLAVSRDRGATWQRVVPSGPDPRVWDVASQPGPSYPAASSSVIVDICTESGPRRSEDGGATFSPTPAAAPFPIGVCSIAHSPSDPAVVFAASRTPGGVGHLWESDDGGRTWTEVWSHPNPGRYPWVQTRRATDGHANHFDLYFHAGADLFRQHCNSSSAGNRCVVAAETGAQCANAVDDDGDDMVNEGCPQTGFNEAALTGAASPPCKNAVDDDSDGSANDGCPLIEYVGGYHDDGGMAFKANDCPLYIASDPGIWRSDDCGRTWQGRNRGLFALQIYDMAGTVHPSHTDLYLATMDNGIWASPDSGVTWPKYQGAEGVWLQAPHTVATHGSAMVTGMFCNSCVRFVAGDHLTNLRVWPPATDINAVLTENHPAFIVPGSDPPRFAQIDAGHLWMREPTGVWAQKLPALPALGTRELFVAGPSADPTIYIVTDRGGIRGLSRITNLNAGTVTITPADTGLGDVFYYSPDDNPIKYPYVVGVAPDDGMHLIVADHSRDVMRVSRDGGATWQTDTALTDLVVDGGKRLFHAPYHGLQPHVIRFNPGANWHILVGTEASGILESCTGGLNWHRIDGSTSIPAITDFAFDKVRRRVYVSSYGRGLWVVDYPPPHDGCWQVPKPMIPAQPLLAVSVSLTPPNPPALIRVLLDGATWLPAAAGGQATGWRPVVAGGHIVQAMVVPPADPRQYTVTIGGDCSATGAITVGSGDRKTCTIAVVR